MCKLFDYLTMYMLTIMILNLSIPRFDHTFRLYTVWASGVDPQQYGGNPLISKVVFITCLLFCNAQYWVRGCSFCTLRTRRTKPKSWAANRFNWEPVNLQYLHCSMDGDINSSWAHVTYTTSDQRSSSSCKGSSGRFHIIGSNTVIFAVLKAWLSHPYTML